MKLHCQSIMDTVTTALYPASRAESGPIEFLRTTAALRGPMQRMTGSGHYVDRTGFPVGQETGGGAQNPRHSVPFGRIRR